MCDILNEKISLFEVLVKTAYLTQITEPADKLCQYPVAFGSGFIVEFDNDNFFVTADHTLHLDDYRDGSNERTGKDYVVSIFNNYTPPENFLSTIVTPLVGFHYMEQFHLDKPDDLFEPVDLTLCKMNEINFTYPFLTDGVKHKNETINKGERKIKIKKECFSEPRVDKKYFIFGKIRTGIHDNIRMYWENTVKEDLKFNSKVGDYFLFNTPEIIESKEDWEGLSGSAVLSEDGECVGVLCSVNENSKSIWIMPITKVKMLIEVAILQENL